MCYTQGRIEEYFLSSIKEYGAIEVERSVMPESIEFDESENEEQDAYPITVRLRNVDSEKSEVFTNESATPNGIFRSNLTPDDTADLLRKQSNTQARETVKAKLPMVITTDLRLNEPRYASLPNIMKAKKKPLEKKTLADYGIEAGGRLKTVKVTEPPARQGGGKVEDVDGMISKLKELGAL